MASPPGNAQSVPTDMGRKHRRLDDISDEEPLMNKRKRNQLSKEVETRGSEVKAIAMQALQQEMATEENAPKSARESENTVLGKRRRAKTPEFAALFAPRDRWLDNQTLPLRPRPPMRRRNRPQLPIPSGTRPLTDPNRLNQQIRDLQIHDSTPPLPSRSLAPKPKKRENGGHANHGKTGIKYSDKFLDKTEKFLSYPILLSKDTEGDPNLLLEMFKECNPCKVFLVERGETYRRENNLNGPSYLGLAYFHSAEDQSKAAALAEESGRKADISSPNSEKHVHEDGECRDCKELEGPEPNKKRKIEGDAVSSHASQSLSAEKDGEGDINMLHEPQSLALCRGKVIDPSQHRYSCQLRARISGGSYGDKKFETFSIRIAGFPVSSTPEDLMKVFEGCGPCAVHLRSLEYTTKELRHALYGWVDFHTAKDQAKAFDVSVQAGLSVKLNKLQGPTHLHMHNNGEIIEGKKKMREHERTLLRL